MATVLFVLGRLHGQQMEMPYPHTTFSLPVFNNPATLKDESADPTSIVKYDEVRYELKKWMTGHNTFVHIYVLQGLDPEFQEFAIMETLKELLHK